MPINILILAAGTSSRLGRPKQLLNIEGESLIERVIKESLKTDCQKIAVVLGAHFEKIKKEINNLPVNILMNENWQDGMSSSLQSGIRFLTKNSPSPDAVIILLCDQPFVNTALLKKIIHAFQESGKGIIASRYNSKAAGVPVLFSKKYFDIILQQEGQAGAKKLLRQYPEDVAYVEFLEGVFDIDTEEDLKAIGSLVTIK